jgi:hypothetical protein
MKLLAAVVSTMILLTGCASTIPPCPPVSAPEIVEIPIPAPCKKLPVVEIPGRESDWTADEIRANVAGFLSALAMDYLRLWDAYVANLWTLQSHNAACYETSVASDDNRGMVTIVNDPQ